jgi:hypothetical protein
MSDEVIFGHLSRPARGEGERWAQFAICGGAIALPLFCMGLM